MTSSSSSSFARPHATGACVAFWLTVLVAAPAVLAQPGAVAPGPLRQAPPALAGESLLAQAIRAEAELRLDAAIDRLYELLIEHPGTDDAVTARIRMARLLAVKGSVPQAMLQCQLLRDELPGDHPARSEALELATLLARRFRAGQSPALPYFQTYEAIAARGMPSLDEPTDVVFESEGRLVLLDSGAGRVFRVGPEVASTSVAPQDPTAIAILRDGTLAVAGKTGLFLAGLAGRLVPLGGSWGGKARQVRKVRSMATASDGSLLVVDRDFEGVLRCQPATGSCAPWGPVGKYRAVRVGPTDWVYLLDDRGQFVRVVDPGGRQLAAIGPALDGAKFGRLEDIAVDRAHGLYLLDTGLKRLLVSHVRTSADGKIGASLSGWVAIPQEGDRATKNPLAIGVSPTGSVLVAGKSQARIMRFR
jgi:hypothetical protein